MHPVGQLFPGLMQYSGDTKNTEISCRLSVNTLNYAPAK